MNTKTATAPSAWASYLINGDASGIEPADQKQADRMCRAEGGAPVDCKDAGFLWNPDYGMAGDCQTYTWLVEESE